MEDLTLIYFVTNHAVRVETVPAGMIIGDTCDLAVGSYFKFVCSVTGLPSTKTVKKLRSIMHRNGMTIL